MVTWGIEKRGNIAFILLLTGFAVSGSIDNAAASGNRPSALSEPPAREPRRLDITPSNVYETICKLGHPVLVSGWDLDPNTRFVYFRGPFASNDVDHKPYDYLYQTISGPNRRRVGTTWYQSADNVHLTDPKPDELARFQLPILTSVESNARRLEQRLGKPDRVRELKRSSRRRWIYNRQLSLGEKLLAGMYLDVADGKVVRAKGIEHPERMAWVMSGNQAPPPDAAPTYYLDVTPREGSPQEILVDLAWSRESGNRGFARELLWEEQMSAKHADEITRQTEPGADIDAATLTYQTTQYGYDEIEATLRYQLSSGTQVESRHRVRMRDDKWFIVD